MIIFWCLILLAFGLMGGAAASVMLLRLVRGIKSSSWPSVWGVITSSEVREWYEEGQQGPDLYTRGSTQYEAEIIYRYTVETSTYNAKRIDTSFRGENRGLNRSYSLSKRYYSGKPVQVYYDPKNPKISVLEPGFKLNPEFFVYPFGILLSVGLAIFFTTADWAPQVSLVLLIAMLCLGLIGGYLIITIIDISDHGEKEREREELAEYEQEEWEQYLLVKQRYPELCAALCALGVNAHFSETIEWIGITESPIGIMEILKVYTQSPKSEIISVRLYVPDPRLLLSLEVQARPIRIWGIFGKAIGLRWKGDDRGIGLINDKQIKAVITKENKNINIHATRAARLSYPKESYWTIFPIEISNLSLSQEQWCGYENIAKRLLILDIPGSTRDNIS